MASTMRIMGAVAGFVLTLTAAAAQTALPELKVEAMDGGSLLRVRNTAAQPLTAYLIELVGYPGSNWAFYREGLTARPVEPGREDGIQITNMTVGAAPEYVKVQAALYADGASAGAPDQVARLLALRRATLETTRELIARLGQGGDKAALAESLGQYAATLPEPGRRERNTPAGFERVTRRNLIFSAAGRLQQDSAETVLAVLRSAERALAGSKPAL